MWILTGNIILAHCGLQAIYAKDQLHGNGLVLSLDRVSLSNKNANLVPVGSNLAEEFEVDGLWKTTLSSWLTKREDLQNKLDTRARV